MKLNEFEEKLGTVSDAKLRQMLTAGRTTGPDVAVKLILAECNRRGMDGLDGEAVPGAYSDEPRVLGSETVAYPQEQAGYAGADAPPAAPDSAEAEAAEAPATAPDWLNEETKSGLPVVAKILIVLVVLGAVLGLAWKFSH
ncbi:MAG: hypothetical protein JWO30_3225 [Fibrobacteres bacterium]|nr:hypothetical protein [Fibrobacterota bacterium]